MPASPACWSGACSGRNFPGKMPALWSAAVLAEDGRRELNGTGVAAGVRRAGSGAGMRFGRGRSTRRAGSTLRRSGRGRTACGRCAGVGTVQFGDQAVRGTGAAAGAVASRAAGEQLVWGGGEPAAHSGGRMPAGERGSAVQGHRPADAAAVGLPSGGRAAGGFLSRGCARAVTTAGRERFDGALSARAAGRRAFPAATRSPRGC